MAWDILDWPADADLSEDNIGYNMRDFLRKTGSIPAAIIARPDQAHILLRDFEVTPPEDAYGFNTIHTKGNGSYKLIIVPRKEQPSEPTKKR